MTVVINGTTGITNDGGYTGDGVVFADTTPANTLVTTTGGNVGVGTSSPTNLAGYRSVTISSTTGGWLEVTNGTVRGALQNGSGDVTLETRSAHPLIFGINGAEKARIDSSGNLLVGTTSASSLPAGSVNIKSGIAFSGGTSGTYYYTFQSNTTDFYIGTQTLSRYAALVGLNTFTAWSFGSDRRIKYDIEDVKYGLQTVLDLKPRQYKFKDGADFSIGFIAQELKQFVPEAVTGEEIEFDDADTPQDRAKKTMGVSKDTLIPVLVKAIQEQQAIITALTARVAALEGTQNV